MPFFWEIIVDNGKKERYIINTPWGYMMLTLSNKGYADIETRKAG